VPASLRASIHPKTATAAAAILVGLTIWLWPASVHIVSWPKTGPQRVAVVAPLSRLWWILAAALIAAGVIWLWPPRTVESRRRRGHTLAPLLLLTLCVVPYLPWLPDRVPVLLIFAGPLRAVVVLIACVLVGVRGLEAWRPSIGLGWTVRSRHVLTIAFALYAVAGLHSLRSLGLSGDEPHYLIISESLLADGDLRIENNHRLGQYRSFTRETLPPDYLQRGKDGAIYSIHAPGLPALLVPAYAIGGAKGAVMAMALLAACAVAAVFQVGREIGGTRAAVWTAAVIGLTVPFVPYAWSIFPEIAAAAMVAWATHWVLTDRVVRPLRWALRGVCLAWLPWFHTKFVILAAGFIVLLLIRLRHQLKAAVAVVAPVVLSCVAWLAFFYVIYGSPNPEAPYGTQARDWVKLQFVPRGVLGLLVDQKFGVLTYAPIYFLVPAGIWLALRDRRWRSPVAALAGLAAVYVISTTRFYMWWGGWSAPARFLVPVTPLFAPPIAVALPRLWRTRWQLAIVALLVVSGAVAALGAVRPADLWLFSDAHAVSRLADSVQGSAPLTATLPTFTEAQWAARDLLPRAYPDEVRRASLILGRTALLAAFDPMHRHAYDYTAGRTLLADEWVHAGTITADVAPPDGAPPAANTHVYDEGDVFWTEGTSRATVFVAPRGHTSLSAMVHIGPGGGTVAMRVGTEQQTLELRPDETREVEFALPPQAAWVAVSVQSSSAFRPADPVRGSEDQRLLGCQVRLTLR
jgi:hypothetical protein